MDWQHLRTVLAIGRGGTLSAAARVLGVNQTTAARHLDTAEQVLGTPLFLRLGGRLQPTAAGQIALERAARMEAEALACQHAIQDEQALLAGPVSLTATEGVVDVLLAPHLSQLYARVPGVRVELLGSHERLSLQRREADLALRLARPRPEPEGGQGAETAMVTRKLADIGYAAYRAQGGPASACPGWLTYSTAWASLPEAQWAADQPEDILLRSNSLGSLVAAAVSGLGWLALPCYLGDGVAGLVRDPRPVPVQRELWLVAHQQVIRLPRVRAVADWVGELIHQRRDWLLAGESPDLGSL